MTYSPYKTNQNVFIPGPRNHGDFTPSSGGDSGTPGGGGGQDYTGSPAAGGSTPGRTYYPVNPLGPFSGPRASDYPSGTATPMTTVPPPAPAPVTPPATPAPVTPPATAPQQPGWMGHGWGIFGGGAPMPSGINGWRDYYQSQHPQGSSSQHGRLAQLLMRGQ